MARVTSKTLDTIIIQGIATFISHIGDARIYGKSAGGSTLNIGIEEDMDGYTMYGNLEDLGERITRYIPRCHINNLEDAVDEAIKIFGDHDIPIDGIDNQTEFI